jgi:Na+/H+ antiporter NhaD/arsenite permease-like protein
MLVGLFLAGLVVHGGVQGWWVVKIFQNLAPTAIMGVSMLLTGFNDNAAISYLATLIPGWADTHKYAIFTGVIAGGGLTVIANAPNPAGYAILSRHFEGGINPIDLLKMALIPTLILYAVFYLFGPLYLSTML